MVPTGCHREEQSSTNWEVQDVFNPRNFQPPAWNGNAWTEHQCQNKLLSPVWLCSLTACDPREYLCSERGCFQRGGGPINLRLENRSQRVSVSPGPPGSWRAERPCRQVTFLPSHPSLYLGLVISSCPVDLLLLGFLLSTRAVRQNKSKMSLVK